MLSISKGYPKASNLYWNKNKHFKFKNICMFERFFFSGYKDFFLIKIFGS